MIILEQSISPQSFKFIPRSYTADTLVIEEEGTDVFTTYTSGQIDPARVNYSDVADTSGTYLQLTVTLSIEQGKFYNMTVKNGSTVIYKDRIFCTNQTISTYTINNGQYISNSTDNDYIIIS